MPAKRAKPAPPDSRVPIATIASAPRLLAQAGIDPERIARAAGLEPSRFDDASTTIAFTEMARYLDGGAGALDDDTFALRVGLLEGPGALEALGFLAMHSADVRGALGTLARYVHQVGGTLVIDEERGVATLHYRFLFPHIRDAHWIIEAGIGLAVAILRSLCGAGWCPLEVHFSRPLPVRPARWQQLLGAPVIFAMPDDAVAFSAKWLAQRLERADPGLRRILLDKVAERELDAGGDFSAQVASVIRAGLLSGEFALPQVARRLAVSPATLKRRLAAASTSHSELLESTRMEMACHLLEHSRAAVTQVSELLGYSHSSAFTRAFHRWLGESPRDWRARRARGPIRGQFT